jgi:hypothetical protein
VGLRFGLDAVEGNIIPGFVPGQSCPWPVIISTELSRLQSISFSLPNPSIRTMALGLTQPVSEVSTRKYFWGVEIDRLTCRTDNLTAICEPIIYTIIYTM